MKETVSVKIMIEGNEIHTYDLTLSRKKDCILEVTIASKKFITTDNNYYDALVMLRKKLEKFKYKILCFGARIDVHASGMSKSMGLGRKAHILNIGKMPNTGDLIDIFEYSSTNIGTVNQQEMFFTKWSNSIKI